MCTHVQNAIDIINDILSKVDDFAKEAPAPGAAAPAGESPHVQKGGKKKDKKAKKAASAAPVAAAENEKASDPFAMADLRVSSLSSSLTNEARTREQAHLPELIGAARSSRMPRMNCIYTELRWLHAGCSRSGSGTSGKL